MKNASCSIHCFCDNLHSCDYARTDNRGELFGQCYFWDCLWSTDVRRGVQRVEFNSNALVLDDCLWLFHSSLASIGPCNMSVSDELVKYDDEEEFTMKESNFNGHILGSVCVPKM